VRRQRQFEQCLVADDPRIEVDLEALGVVPDAVVRGIGRVTAGIANACPPDSFDDPKLGVRRPESTDGEGRGFEMRRHERVYWWSRKWLGGHVARGEEALHCGLLCCEGVRPC